ncbi:MAG: hypothetical protein ACYDCM_03890 [Candidatus Acidiferrales bacterium]
MKQEANLTNIFKLQDLAFCQNQRESGLIQSAVVLISKATSVNYEILSGMKFDAGKQTAIRHFAGDILSSIVVAVRLGLWGALPESLAVLRGGIESSAQLAFVVTEQKYNTVILEAKKRFRQVSFEAACAGLGKLGADLERTHGRISGIAAHSTSRRFTLMNYELNGETYDRLGFTLSAENAELAIFQCLDPFILLAYSLETAYKQDNLVFPWAEKLKAIKDGFDAAVLVFQQHQTERSNDRD